VIVGSVAPGEAAIFGSLLARICRDKGVAAVVTNGLVRDIDQIRDAGFPVFAGGITILGPTKVDPGRLQEPVTIGDAVVSPGDWVIGDSDGVVVIPAAALEETLAAAEAVEAREAEMVRRAAEGVSTVEQLGLAQPA
jgi:4-hydroxy-4-methyl-2-oxoglutarate aldolase